MTADEFDSLRRGDVVHDPRDGVLGLILRRGKRIATVLWEDKWIGDGNRKEMLPLTIVARATLTAAQEISK